MQLKAGKSPGIDGIPAEVYQCRGEMVLSTLQYLFTNCWEKGILQQDLRGVVIVCRRDPGSWLAKRARPNNSTGKHTRSRKPM